MKVCTDCRKVMVCTRTGVHVVFGHRHAYAGDEHQCPECGSKCITTNPSPYMISEASKYKLRENGYLVEMG